MRPAKVQEIFSCFQNLFSFLSMEFDQSARAILHVESRAVRRHASLTQNVELLDPLLLLFVQFIHHVPLRKSFFGQLSNSSVSDC